jgi:hypothetical protein
MFKKYRLGLKLINSPKKVYSDVIWERIKFHSYDYVIRKEIKTGAPKYIIISPQIAEIITEGRSFTGYLKQPIAEYSYQGSCIGRALGIFGGYYIHIFYNLKDDEVLFTNLEILNTYKEAFKVDIRQKKLSQIK